MRGTLDKNVRPLTADEFQRIERRHDPHERDGLIYCTRDWDEQWPCDAARLLATIGEAYAAGALAEYRETKRVFPK